MTLTDATMLYLKYILYRKVKISVLNRWDDSAPSRSSTAVGPESQNKRLTKLPCERKTRQSTKRKTSPSWAPIETTPVGACAPRVSLVWSEDVWWVWALLGLWLRRDSGGAVWVEVEKNNFGQKTKEQWLSKECL